MASIARSLSCGGCGHGEGVQQRAHHVIAAGEHDHIHQPLHAEMAGGGLVKLVFDMQFSAELQRELLGDPFFLVQLGRRSASRQVADGVIG